MSSGPHVSISAETVAYVGSMPITNSMVTSLVVSVLIVSVAVIIRLKLNRKTIKPSGIQNVAEWIVEALYNMVHSITGSNQKAQLFLPIIATFFLFILVNNWFGLLPIVGSIVVPKPEEPTQHTETVSSTNLMFPTAFASTQAQENLEIDAALGQTGGEPSESNEGVEVVSPEEFAKEAHTTEYVSLFRPATADLNMTFALALVSMVIVQFWGLKYLHLGYLKKFINLSSPINFFVGILELISELAKVISFAFRLFGNIFAGEVLLVVVTYLTKIIIPIPFYGLEVFVGFIQALVFSMLSLVFYNMATHKH